jgi:cytochrome c-type biogenesis protein CcsB
MAVWASIFAIAVFATISKFSVFAPATFGTYTASTFFGDSRMAMGLRANIPFVGWFLVVAGLALVGVIVAFMRYLKNNDETARTWGHRLLWTSLAAQGAAIVALVWQVKTLKAIVSQLDPRQYERFSVWMMQQDKMTPEQIAQYSSSDLHQMAEQWIRQNGSMLKLSLNANPVELAALITAFAATLFVVIFSFRTERLRAAMPPAEKLDSLLYKLAGVVFAGLALLLMTGAIWANESWGRYWGWDSKETGAFVAWLTYAAFLHSRIARGWSGRRSAYFAVVAFLLVIFTYLGVSYLLPGLHSYA